MASHVEQPCPSNTRIELSKLLKYILLPAVMMMCVMTLSSCVNEDGPTLGSDPEEDAVLVLNVGLLGDTQSGRIVDDNTLIRSLRVVIISDGEVEYNDKIYLERPVEEYHLMYLVSVGHKQIYLIANAEDITLYDSSAAAPTTAAEFFKRFPQGSTGFEDAVNKLYFDNTYYESALTDSHPLPLTSKYEIDALPGRTQEFTFWLVRAATKYTVHFENKRTSPIYLNELSISSLYNQMYLMPQVGSDQNEISGMFWIDWLNHVAELSHEEENLADPDFNTNMGWITDYSIPGTATSFVFYPVKDETRLEIPGLQTSAGQGAQPGTLNLGPYYATEGKNIVNGAQSYTLSLKLTDTKDSQVVDLNRALPTLGSLFRNTHVIIYITFDESYMHVYGEIAGWTSYDVYGKLTEE